MGETYSMYCLFLALLSTGLVINLFKALKSFVVKEFYLPNFMLCQTCRLYFHKSPVDVSQMITVSLNTILEMLLFEQLCILGNKCLCEGQTIGIMIYIYTLYLLLYNTCAYPPHSFAVRQNFEIIILVLII